MCSVEEGGLYDYVIVNDDLQSAYQHFSSVAKRALDGQVMCQRTMPLSIQNYPLLGQRSDLSHDVDDLSFYTQYTTK